MEGGDLCETNAVEGSELRGASATTSTLSDGADHDRLDEVLLREVEPLPQDGALRGEVAQAIRAQEHEACTLSAAELRCFNAIGDVLGAFVGSMESEQRRRGEFVVCMHDDGNRPAHTYRFFTRVINSRQQAQLDAAVRERDDEIQGATEHCRACQAQLEHFVAEVRHAVSFQ